MTSGKLDIVRDVLQECGIERGGFIESQWRYQSRFGAPRRRGFGHDGHAASRGRREGSYGVRHPVAAGMVRACEASLTRLALIISISTCCTGRMGSPTSPALWLGPGR